MLQPSAPYQKVRITIPLSVVKEEAKNLWYNEYYVEHRGNNSQGWFAFTLYGEGPYITLGGDWGDKKKYHWTEIALKYCPQTVAWIKQLPIQEIYRARFMFITPGGYIKLHNDKEPSEKIGYTVVNDAMNIAIINAECKMYQIYKNHYNIVPFEDGAAFFFNNRYFHYVDNPVSSTLRIHMIIHAKWYSVLAEPCKLQLYDKYFLDHDKKFYGNKNTYNEYIEAYSPNLSCYY